MINHPFLLAFLFFCVGPALTFAAGVWFGRVTAVRGMPRVTWSKASEEL